MSGAVPATTLTWYWHRLRRFQRGELQWRIRNAIQQRQWMRRFGDGDHVPPVGHGTSSGSFAELRIPVEVDRELRDRVLATAQAAYDGAWPIFGVMRNDLANPDWSSDDASSIETSRVDIDGTPQSEPDMKATWELSRHHVLTVLAAATYISGDQRYAQRAATLLRSWLDENQSLRSSVHWSNVEIAQRLISWTWMRRLGSASADVRLIFESEQARRMIFLHLDWLHRFPSRYSSANNHRMAESAGLLTGASAFGDLVAVDHLRADALADIAATLQLQIGPSGLQREPALDYHCFVLDLCVVALAEASRSGLSVGPHTLVTLARMADALVRSVDADLRAPRFGDSDESEVAQMDPPGSTAATRSLSLAAACIGQPSWWPRTPATLRAATIRAFAEGALHASAEPVSTEQLARTGYLALLRSPDNQQLRSWAAMRVGQFSFLPIGSHSHCDLLAVEFRVDGHDIVVDPGTYVYGALAGWRQHLRSTASHPTLMLEGTDQAEYWGPFLWGTDASAEIVACDRDPVGHITGWRAEHDGYRRLTPTARVSRGLELRPDSLTITDLVLRSAASKVRLAFPLSPLCDVVPGRSPSEFHGEVGPIRLRFDLPETLSWRLVPRGEIPAGMMSPSFGRLEAAHSLIGSGSVSADHPLISVISFSRVPPASTVTAYSPSTRVEQAARS